MFLRKKKGLAIFLCLMWIAFPAHAKLSLGSLIEGKKEKLPRIERSSEYLMAPVLGEKLRYEVKYLGLVIGEAEAWVKEIVEIDGRDAYHVEVKIESKSVIDLVYKVRDFHHSYIDVENLHTLKYVKNLSEGDYKVHEEMTYDQELHEAEYYSHSNGSRKLMYIPKNVQDPISGGFLYRTLPIEENETRFIDVNADEKNWKMEIQTHGIEKIKIRGLGVFEAMKVQPIVKFEGFFVKRGTVVGWMSMGSRRIPLKMQVRIPVLGSVTAELSRYESGTYEL